MTLQELIKTLDSENLPEVNDTTETYSTWLLLEDNEISIELVYALDSRLLVEGVYRKGKLMKAVFHDSTISQELSLKHAKLIERLTT
jgi:hypothetical protein